MRLLFDLVVWKVGREYEMSGESVERAALANG